MNINLPTAMKTWLHRQSKRDGFGTVSEFVQDLVRREQERARIEKKLLSSLDSGPATSWTEDDWQGLQNIIDKKRKSKTRKSHA